MSLGGKLQFVTPHGEKGWHVSYHCKTFNRLLVDIHADAFKLSGYRVALGRTTITWNHTKMILSRIFRENEGPCCLWELSEAYCLDIYNVKRTSPENE